MSNTKVFQRIFTKFNKPSINTMTNFQHVKLCRVSEYNSSILIHNKYKPFRAGVIPYTIFNNDIYFAFGVDASYQDLTDFGGGVNLRDNSRIHGGIREFQEECLSVFAPICPQDINDNYVIFNRGMLIILVYYDVNPTEISEKFKQQLSNKKHEVVDIVWLNTHDLIRSLSGQGRKIYSRVRTMLNSIPTPMEKFLQSLNQNNTQ